MTTSTPQRPGSKRRNPDTERGATMVEFAIITVALFTMIFGIIEGGFAVRARNTVNNAIDDAARRAAVAGTNPNADYLVLQQLIGRGADTAASMKWVVIYKADNGSDPVPALCDSDDVDNPPAPQPGLCNVYIPSQFYLGEGSFGCTGNGTAWCPETRTTGGDLGFIGVHVEARYEPIIDQLFADFSFDVSANSLQVIETSGEL